MKKYGIFVYRSLAKNNYNSNVRNYTPITVKICTLQGGHAYAGGILLQENG